VVLSSDKYHANRQEVIVAAITSRLRDDLLFGDHLLTAWQEAGLPKPSVVTAILRTVKRGLVMRKLGSLAEGDLRAVSSQLSAVLPR